VTIVLIWYRSKYQKIDLSLHAVLFIFGIQMHMKNGSSVDLVLLWGRHISATMLLPYFRVHVYNFLNVVYDYGLD
jgi:hypothetical protein